MASEIGIKNKAILIIGNEVITDGDGSKLSDIADELYPLCLETALSEHNWTFAIKRVILSAAVETPPFGYTSKFLLPSDFNHIVVEEDDEYVFREEEGYLLADTDSINLVYVSNSFNVTKMKSKFEDAVVTLLASKMAYAIVGSGKLAFDLEGLFEKRLAKAKLQNSAGIGYKDEDVSWVEDRS